MNFFEYNNFLLDLFESQLARQLPDAHIDYDTFWAKLSTRIEEAEQLQHLSILKADIVVPQKVQEQIEQTLFEKIQNYCEYQQPIDECIAAEKSQQSQSLFAAEKALERKLDEAETIPLWEQILKTETIASQGTWEKIEEQLDKKLDEIQKAPSWEQVVKTEMVFSVPQNQKVELMLDTAIDANIGNLPWENFLKLEVLGSSQFWEKIENGLFDRINRLDKATDLAKQPFWTLLRLFTSQHKILSYAVTAVFVALCVIFPAYQYYLHNNTITTFVYMAQGQNADVAKTNTITLGHIASEKGGSITLVNTRGYVEIQNGSELLLTKASSKHICYETRFAGVNNQLVGQGSVTFFVSKKNKNEKFTVITRDYRVEVTGTYFRLQPDIGGHVSATVFEGALNIVFPGDSIIRIQAGQILAFDMGLNQYVVRNNGQSLSINDIAKLPDISELKSYKMLYIKSNATGAEVRINGKFVGITPLSILQPAGLYRIRLQSQGYTPTDTLINIEGASGFIELSIQLYSTEKDEQQTTLFAGKQQHPQQNDLSRTVVSKHSISATEPKQPPQPPNDTAAADTTERYFAAAEAMPKEQWLEAVKLYAKILSNPSVASWKKEVALFSIGKLTADNSPDKTLAKETFLKYLALYPNGSFVGESWLRLAELEFEQNPNKAIEYYLKYFEKFPRHHRIWELQERVGLIYLQHKNYDEAIAMFKQALVNMPNSDTARRNRIESSMYRALQEKNQAKASDNSHSAK